MRNNAIMFVVGTRPEGIKVAPVYNACQQRNIPVSLCATLQHGHLLTEVLDLFSIKPDITLHVGRHGQDLFYLTQVILQKTKELFSTIRPSLVVVQGDTTTSMATALAAFYLQIPVAHIEAGLRTYDPFLPFPEEVNRKIISSIARYHFAPTELARNCLLKEGYSADKVICTGNTVIDALRIIKERIDSKSILVRSQLVHIIEDAHQKNKKIWLFTIHRREVFDHSIVTLLHVLRRIVEDNPSIICIYPYHPNPAVIDAINHLQLKDISNLILIEPLLYHDLVYVLYNAHLVITDSGGLQEEAVGLSKKVFVLRDKTERMEGVHAGYATMVGTDARVLELLLHDICNDPHAYDIQNNENAIYGDGHASEKIIQYIEQIYDDLPKIQQKMSGASIVKKDIMKKVCVIGLGYIGLPTAIVAADAGYSVAGFDVDCERVTSINAGDPIIYEPEIFERLLCVIGSHSFKAYTEIQPADYFIIAVPTPLTSQNKADLSYVYAAVDSICSVIKSCDTIIIESTISVGTSDAVASYIFNKTGLQVGIDIFVAHCPERVLPGKIFYELVNNDRIIGGVTSECTVRAKEFYQAFVQAKLYTTEAKKAELVKLVENSSRDVQIAFAHQVAAISESLDIDAYDVIDLANKHPRVSILQPSVGVGGHCIAIDPWFLAETFPEQTALIQCARTINNNRPIHMIQKIKKTIEAWKSSTQRIPKVLLLGASYKPNVDDIRESPSLFIIQELIHMNVCHILVHDPYVSSVTMKKLFDTLYVSLSQGLIDADIIVFLVAHERFKAIDVSTIGTKKILDLCGVMRTAMSVKDLECMQKAYSNNCTEASQ